MLAPALASVFVILCLCAFIARQPKPAEGVPIHLYPLHQKPNISGGCPNRQVVLWLTRDGKMRIDDTEIQPDRLRPILAEVFENRYDRRAYVVADSDVSYGQFADFISRIVGASSNLDVVLLSGQLRHQAETEPVFECLAGLGSPESHSQWVHPEYLP